MSLNIYTDTEGTLLSESSITTKHNGFVGGADTFSFYLRNDNEEYSYSGVNVEIAVNQSLVNDGWKSKIHYGSENLSESEWDELQSSTSLEAIEDTEYHHFQARVYCPAGQVSEVYKDQINIQVNATESV